jgi:hypothetical protein
MVQARIDTVAEERESIRADGQRYIPEYRALLKSHSSDLFSAETAGWWRLPTEQIILGFWSNT